MLNPFVAFSKRKMGKVSFDHTWHSSELLTGDDTIAATVGRLSELKEALVTAEPVTAELDRGLRVLMPSQAKLRVQLPPDFFSVSAEEIKREQQAR